MSSTARKMAAVLAAGATVVAGLALAPSVSATPPSNSPSELAGDPGAVAALWTPAARAAAIPRDLVIDERGLGYLKRANGSLEPYGHSTPALAAQPRAVSVEVTGSPMANGAKPQPSKGKPSADSTKPVVTINSPLDGDDLAVATLFSATVTDESGVRSVDFEYSYDGGTWLKTTAPPTNDGDTWSQTVTFSVDGPWRFRVTASDASRNTASETLNFIVSMNGSSGTGGSNDGTVTNAQWSANDTVRSAAGRIYFEMPSNKRQTRWTGYVCSGTAVTDTAADASVILTAAHCVYDDANKAFARNVMFIPNQAGTTGTRTDGECANDPIGCWAPAYGVVDANWTQNKFPDNIPWDYAYYVVPAKGSHTPGIAGSTTPESLEAAAGTLPISFGGPTPGKVAAALGYSYSDDPDFMYCQENLGTINSTLATGVTTNWWLSQCGLSGGASGGPWIQSAGGGVDGNAGPIISVNSWGYSTQPGMAGPKLSGTSASCVKALAEHKADSAAPGSGGYVFSGNCP